MNTTSADGGTSFASVLALLNRVTESNNRFRNGPSGTLSSARAKLLSMASEYLSETCRGRMKIGFPVLPAM
ncbi:hypothetical protein D3C71_1607000 [compost metagenome]